MTRLGGAARLLSFVVVAWLLTITPVRSEVATVEADAPIVRVQALQGNVTIRTWDRAYVQIEGDPATYSVEHRVNRIPALLPPAPISPGRIEGPDGLIELPAESFVVSTLPAGPRDLVQLKGTQVGTLTLTVPYNSPVVGVILGRGSVTVNDYRGGTLIAHVRNGRMWLRNFGGDAFVQI
ncbi:MAG TPA: hypothetical protein VKG44_03225, partial [Candidatus Baltobacteraceae bacterium]|nr:hypothetical protein [Candidatus Baltobacteraceae bacterium]